MTKSFTLQPLLDLAQQKNEAATQRLGQLNQQKQTAQTKLDTLMQYRKDYQDKFQEAVRNGMDPVGMNNFQHFIYRLDDAITQQRAVMNQTQHLVQAGQNELKDAQRKMKSFDTLAQRHVESVKKQEAKLDQRTQDEYASRIAAYKNTPKNDTTEQ
ncbi:MAG: flagellar export protein FliJ [Nitrosomonadales bacterium]|nr:flagellar export protein FliJ [Nitrosomonadales bacterium]